MKKIKEHQEQVKKLKLMIGIRLGLVSLILGVGAVILQVERFPFYILVGFFYFSSIFYLILLKSKISHLLQTTGQLALDVITLLGILHFSGGIDSVFIPLLMIPLIGAGILLPGSWCLGFTLSVSLGYLTGVALEILGVWPIAPHIELPHREMAEVGFITAYRLLLFWVVVFLSATLSRKLKMESKALRQLKNLHDIILEQIGTGILTVNTDHEIVFVNKGAQELIGASAEELLGLNWKSLFFFANSNFASDSWEESAQAIRGFEVSLRRQDGTKIPIGFNVTPLRDANNEYCGKVMIFRDLTRIKELERKKQQAERLAAIGEMAAGIAHEIRNPLASISGSVEILLRKNAFDSRYATLVDIILKEAHRLNNIVENFLNYSRRPELERRWVDLDQVLEEVVLLLRNNGKWSPSVAIQKVNLIEGKTHFWFDPNQMKQVFYNLLGNACESMPEGGDIEIRLSETQDVPTQVKVEILDEGCGIPDEVMPKIFTPFFTTKQNGSGIGLPIVHRIVQDHGGTIEVKSHVGQGSAFTLLFPRGIELRRAA